MPTRNSGVVVFAHDGEPERRVAEALQREHVGTVLVDLGGVDQGSGGSGSDVPVLAGRLAAVVDWLADQPATGGNPVGLFGADGGAAVALVVAAERPAAVRAVVSVGGHPDRAEDALTRVLAPALLVLEEGDEHPAAHQRVEVVPGAGRLAGEPDALDRVIRLASRWFHHHVGTAPVAPPTS
ncbi:alpha/beta fold hydrolase [Saccharothrix syringae]|uniref:Alpha/beta fold hydrolase n=2 Tax=Saccharothrix syringae TaxID=103733 RepID=A0A5Q0HFN7_SACSY|nr:alpha/beta fold hydrolase [Saccharothrix syringae]